MSGQRFSLLERPDTRRTGHALPLHPAGALRKGARVHSPLESCVGILLLQPGQLRAYLLSEDGRDVTLYRLFGGGGVHPVGLLRDGLGEHRPVY